MISARNLDNALSFGLRLIVALTALFLLVPVFITMLMSLDARDYFGAFPPTSFSTRWFYQFLHDRYLWSGFRTSILLASVASLVSTVVGSSAAVAINRMPPWRRDAVTTLFLSPLMLPGVIIGFALVLFFSSANILPTFWKLLVGHLLITIPFTVRMTLIGLAGISVTLREAALSLGANERQAFLTVVFPLARNSIAAGALFAFALSLDDFAISLFLSDVKTYTLPVALVSLMRSNFDLTLAAAAVFLLGLSGFILFVLDRVLGVERAISNGIYEA
ncbi:ABC transporter permease (plasmid) [Mesorhizobium sp. AR07]|uniref:ABC transporter permease n=1 Tax=Mesorhizobium sp. AR07 TaxID=2865838 RepID=UPI002161067C|nr:ABC transporter permease [Mesorhizobium sp. AR07]UVK49011.1 ABC transporter permease [Mesorhizobium sp. AR07]